MDTGLRELLERAVLRAAENGADEPFRRYLARAR
jgi:hypothetical protein